MSVPFSKPQLEVVRAGELPLSGSALLELMRAVLARGVPFRFMARGWSMVPFIRDGDVITVAPIVQTLPGIGAVVAFVCPGNGKLVVHRVVARGGAEVLIQGDGIAEHSDGMIPPENLLGQVICIERGGKEVWLGLGLERYLIAGLSRLRLLIPLSMWLANIRSLCLGGSRSK